MSGRSVTGSLLRQRQIERPLRDARIFGRAQQTIVVLLFKLGARGARQRMQFIPRRAIGIRRHDAEHDTALRGAHARRRCNEFLETPPGLGHHGRIREAPHRAEEGCAQALNIIGLAGQCIPADLRQRALQQGARVLTECALIARPA
jgi:hypothetical protein